jgi:quinolinate synthase
MAVTRPFGVKSVWDKHAGGVLNLIGMPEDVEMAKNKYPGAVFIAHPECRPEVLALADVVASTSGMLRYARESNHDSYIVGTETGLIYPMQKGSPGKKFFPASEKMVCPNMKRISPEDVVKSLEGMTGEVKVPEDIRIPALQAVQKMLELSK